MPAERHIDEDLRNLRLLVLEMGGLCEEMLHLAVRMLIERDPTLLPAVQGREARVNRLHVEIDGKCVACLALRQPAAGDLRLVAAALKISTELERVGDQAVNIAQTSLHALRLPRMRLYEVPRMAEIAAAMLKGSLDSFARGDVEAARAVLRGETEEDDLKRRSFNGFLELMQGDASMIQPGLQMILIGRNLERVADHATNIAEDAVFMVLGKDIRHHAADIEAAAALP
jgi:phosphate transport system protein